MNQRHDNTAEILITEVAYPGRGVARHNGCVIFTAGVLPGERVRVRFTHAAKNFSEAELVAVLEPSPHRVEPSCRYAGACQGCCYQHVDYAEELRIKQMQFSSLLQRLGKIKDLSVILEPTPCPAPLGYRNKVGFHVVGTGPDRRIGYFAADNESIMDIESCPLAVPEINAKYASLRNDRTFLDSIAGNFTINMRYTEHDSVVYWTARLPVSERVNSEEDIPWLTEGTAIGPVRVPRDSFFQVNRAVADMLVDAVSALIRDIKPANVIDLYCGVGVFALAAAKAGVATVSGIDCDPLGILAAKTNAESMHLGNVTFSAQSAVKSIKHALRAANTDNTTLILDPPRRGVEKTVVEAIANFKPANVIYISCAPDTLSRDIAFITAGGYTLKSARIFDMFPRTPYFESLSWLTPESQ